MKMNMKHLTHAPLITGTLGILVCLHTAPVIAAGNGTDILHFTARAAMQNPGTVPDAAGRVQARRNSQGNADNQTLDIAVSKLGANTHYKLAVPDLAPPDPLVPWTVVYEFDTDADGKAVLRFRKLGNGKSVGHGKLSLPSSLTPVSILRTLAILDASSLVVLTVDLGEPDKLQYLVKRYLNGAGTVKGTLRIKATTDESQFRLVATGLTPDSPYTLAVNDLAAQTGQSDAEGKLVMNTWLLDATDILDLASLKLWDSLNDTVLSTTFP